MVFEFRISSPYSSYISSIFALNSSPYHLHIFSITRTIVAGENEGEDVELEETNYTGDGIQNRIRQGAREPIVSFTEFMQGFNRATAGMEIEPDSVSATCCAGAPVTTEVHDVRIRPRDRRDVEASASASRTSTSTGMMLPVAPRLPQVRVSPDGQWQVAHSSLSQDPEGGWNQRLEYREIDPEHVWDGRTTPWSGAPWGDEVDAEVEGMRAGCQGCNA
jgi:hypothetical protein